jgi:BRCA1-associated protein
MDASVTGLLTILCQHTFHCQCLTKWGDGSCPICRYSQKKDASDQTRESHVCKSCPATQDLWIWYSTAVGSANNSLICGHIGCGRYNGAHAFDHHLSTNHLYALELETQRVWDYAGDGYVHRLIQTKSDGKLVEFPPVASTGTYFHPADRAVEDDLSREKLDAMGMEYTYLLTTQLDSQRIYYEERIAAAADKASKASKAVDQANTQISKLEKRLEEYDLQMRMLGSERDRLVASVAEGVKAKERVVAKCVRLGETARKWQKELQEEKVLTEGLMVNAKTLTDENEVLKNEKSDLQEQNQDLMFMLENMGRDDIKGGDVGVVTKKASRRGRK